MTYVIIRRCPVCPTINALVDRLFAAFKNSRDLLLVRIDGALDEFSIIVDGESIPTMHDDCLRPAEDLIADIRDAIHSAAVA